MPATVVAYGMLGTAAKLLRVSQLKEAAKRIAGGGMEDVTMLLADAAGAANNTSRSIGKAVSQCMSDGNRLSEDERSSVNRLLHQV